MSVAKNITSTVRLVCGHEICRNLVRCGASISKGVSTVVYDGSDIIVGRVGLGKKFGSLVTCSGKFDKTVDRCCLDTAIRELCEEFKITRTSNRFECAAIVNGTIVLLFNCHGLDFAEMQRRVMDDHQDARRIIGLTDDGACKGLEWRPDESPAVTCAATIGEMQALVRIPYVQLRLDKDVLPYCVTNIHVMMQWKLNHSVVGSSHIAWSAVK